MSKEIQMDEKKKTSSLAESADAGAQSEKLDQLVSFVKENWKTVLTELVTTGVTTYLAHSKNNAPTKEKASH